MGSTIRVWRTTAVAGVSRCAAAAESKWPGNGTKALHSACSHVTGMQEMIHSQTAKSPGRMRLPGNEYLVGKAGCCTEFFFDSNQLIVFCDPVRAGHGAGFDLPAVYPHRKVGDKGVLGFP